MADKRYFVDVFGDIVAAVRAEYDPTNILAPYYMYGHPREIANRLSLKNQNDVDKFRKFPLVALLTDVTETHGDSMLYDYNIPFTVIIVTSTNKNYVSEERYTNTLKPILYPIYELLLQKIDESEDVFTIDDDLIPHEKTDRLFWGSAGIYGNDGLIFNEYLDAIEINFDGINVIKDTALACQ